MISGQNSKPVFLRSIPPAVHFSYFLLNMNFEMKKLSAKERQGI